MMIISQYPQHHQKILYGYLRSAGYYNSPLVISLIGIYGCRVLLSYIFGFLLHWNIVWIWIAMDVDQWARDIFAAIIFKVRNVKSYVKEQTNAAKC
jgi:Na+-driven multidrug efflux pump